MARVVKWLVGLVVVLVLLAAAAVALGLQLADRKRMRIVEVPVQPVAYHTDPSVLPHGRYLYLSRGCAECHGADGGGKMFVDDGQGTRLAGPNITPAGVVARYQPVDWVRTIRHGVKPDGRPAMVMPSEDYNRFTDADLAALVAYVRSLPPKPPRAAVVEYVLPARVMYGFGLIPDAAQRIDHQLPPAKPVAVAETVEHGGYVANACIGCHGDHLSGGKIVTGPPDWPPAANLTPGEGSAMPRYPDVDAFVKMIRSGKRPDGSAIAVMPFESLAMINDTDLRALYSYLQSVPARPAGSY